MRTLRSKLALLCLLVFGVIQTGLCVVILAMRESDLRQDFDERLAVLVTAALALWSALATLFTFAGLSFRILCIAYTAALPLALLLLIRYPMAS